MLYLDTPSSKDIARLNDTRAGICVSVYLPTTPLTQEVRQSRIGLKNLTREAIAQLEGAGHDKRDVAMIEEHLNDLADDDEFWRFQAHSLAIFVTLDQVRTFRLANNLGELVEVSDRFHLKPLIRAVTFPHSAYVLALSENAARLVRILPDLPAQEVEVDGMPESIAEAIGMRTGDDSPAGPNVPRSRMVQYVRKIDGALRPLLASGRLPLVLAAAQPLDSVFRSITSLAPLDEGIAGSHDHLGAAELAEAARAVLDAHYARQIEDFRRLYQQRKDQRRATGDLAEAARAATFGNVDRLLVDIGATLSGFVDEENGEVTLDDAGDALNYGVVDEIAGRAMRTGATVLGVRADEIPGGQPLAAILRSPI